MRAAGAAMREPRELTDRQADADAAARAAQAREAQASQREVTAMHGQHHGDSQREGHAATAGRSTTPAGAPQYNQTLAYNRPSTNAPVVPLHGPSEAHAVQVAVPADFERCNPKVGVNLLRALIDPAQAAAIDVACAAKDLPHARQLLRAVLAQIAAHINAAGDAAALALLTQAGTAANTLALVKLYFAAAQRLHSLRISVAAPAPTVATLATPAAPRSLSLALTQADNDARRGISRMPAAPAAVAQTNAAVEKASAAVGVVDDSLFTNVARGRAYLNARAEDLAAKCGLYVPREPASIEHLQYPFEGAIFHDAVTKRIIEYVHTSGGAGLRALVMPEDLAAAVGSVITTKTSHYDQAAFATVLDFVGQQLAHAVQAAVMRIGPRFVKSVHAYGGEQALVQRGDFAYDGQLESILVNVLLATPAVVVTMVISDKAAAAAKQAQTASQKQIAALSPSAAAAMLDRTLAMMQRAAQLASPWQQYVTTDTLLWTDQQRAGVLAMPLATLAQRAPSYVAQTQTVQAASDGIAAVTRAYPARQGESDRVDRQPIRNVLGLYCAAINQAHQPGAGTAAGKRAQRAAAMLSMDLLALSMADSRAAATGYADQRQQTPGFKQRAHEYSETPSQALATQRAADRTMWAQRQQVAACATVDDAAVTEVAIASAEHAIEQRLETILLRAESIMQQSDNASKAALAEVLFHVALPVQKVLQQFRDAQNQLASLGPAQRLGARQKHVADAEQGLHQASTDHDFQGHMQRALELIDDARLRKALFDMALLLGIGLITMQIGSMAGSVTRGMYLANSVRGTLQAARIASALGTVVGVVTDAVLLGAAQTAVSGGQFGTATLDNIIMNALTMGALRPFGELSASLHELDHGVQMTWQRVATGWAISGAMLSLEMVQGAAVAFAYQQAVHAGPVSLQHATDWLQQGASMALAKFLGGKLHAMEKRMQALGEHAGTELIQRIESSSAAAAKLEHRANRAAVLAEVERYQTLVKTEAAVLARVMKTGGGLQRVTDSVAQLRAEHVADAQSFGPTQTLMLRWQATGMTMLSADTELWMGTHPQIEKAIAAAGPEAAKTVHRSADGRVKIMIEGRTYELVPHGLSAASAQPQHSGVATANLRSAADSRTPAKPRVVHHADSQATGGHGVKVGHEEPLAGPHVVPKAAVHAAERAGTEQMVDAMAASKALPEQHAHEQGSVPVEAVLSTFDEGRKTNPAQRDIQIDLLQRLIAVGTGRGPQAKNLTVKDLSPEGRVVVNGVVSAPKDVVIASIDGELDLGLLNRILEAKQNIQTSETEANPDGRDLAVKALSDVLIEYRNTLSMQKPEGTHYDATINAGNEFFARYKMISEHGLRSADVAHQRASASELGMQELRYSPDGKDLTAVTADAAHLNENGPRESDVSLTYAPSKNRLYAEPTSVVDQRRTVDVTKAWYTDPIMQKAFNGVDSPGVEHGDKPPALMWEAAAERTFRNAKVMVAHLQSQLSVPGSSRALAERISRIAGSDVGYGEVILARYQSKNYDAALDAVSSRALQLHEQDAALKTRRQTLMTEKWQPALPALDGNGRIVEVFHDLRLETVASETRLITEALRVWSADTGIAHGQVTMFGLTVHAGEQVLSKENISVFQLLDQVDQAVSMGADRIGHALVIGIDADVLIAKGVLQPRDKARFIARRRDVIARVKAAGVVIEANLSSNQEISNLTNNEHPTGTFVEEGLKVTINTDDETVLATTMKAELKKVAQLAGVSRVDVATMILEGYRSRMGNRELHQRSRIKPELERGLTAGLDGPQVLELANKLAAYFHVQTAADGRATLGRVIDAAIGL